MSLAKHGELYFLLASTYFSPLAILASAWQKWFPTLLLSSTLRVSVIQVTFLLWWLGYCDVTVNYFIVYNAGFYFTWKSQNFIGILVIGYRNSNKFCDMLDNHKSVWYKFYVI
jgi:hypothetical protein